MTLLKVKRGKLHNKNDINTQNSEPFLPFKKKFLQYFRSSPNSIFKVKITSWWKSFTCT